MDRTELDRLFEDPANWRWGIFYNCPSDSRVIAPRHPRWRGYQINFAHPKAVPTLLFYLVVLFCPASLAFALGPHDVYSLAVAVGVAFAISVAILTALSAHLSARFDG